MLGRSMQAVTLCLGNQTATPPQREPGVHLTGILELVGFCNRKTDTPTRSMKNRHWHQTGNPWRWIIGSVLHYILVSSLLKCLRLPIKSLMTVSRHTSQVKVMHSAWNISLKRVVVTLWDIVCTGWPKTCIKKARFEGTTTLKHLNSLIDFPSWK